MINNQEKVLVVGPFKEDLKGGIYEVIKAFKDYDDNIHIYNTIFSQNTFLNTLFFLLSIPVFLWRAKQFNLFHFHTSVTGSLYRKSILIFLLSFLFSKKKIILQIHSGKFIEFYEENLNRKKYINFIFRKSNTLLFITKDQYNYFSNLNLKCDLKLIKNPIQRRNAPHKNFNLQQPLKILFLGKITKQKGVYDLIDVANKLEQEVRRNIEFLVAGIGEINSFKIKIKDQNLTNIIRYIGWLNPKEKAKYLKSSDILILPSYSEAMPMSILEGMSFGLPIIATPVGAIPQLVNHKNGFLYTPGNINQLASCITYCIKNRTELKKLSTQSYLYSKDYFIDNVYDELNQIYKQLL
ncbi:glycosyltransferase [Mesonia aestuariivivens]|uniref:Glycosyltransferase n=1 Tax=Mesonia aestuariivivens TaxID=2796128 RepID=A0ABS6W127_9FLAO|nr:glycosyltransferase [Mesonia aestuariivivens]MBW2961524.1 glycosyltransferase [Mesonia aestuariivivens]